MRPLHEISLRSLVEARETLGSDGLDQPLDVAKSMLFRPSEPQQQRQVCRQSGMPALLAYLAARITDPNG